MGARTKLHDDDRMPFGKWKGTRLGEVPDHYWKWFLQQPWAANHPELLEYAQLVEGDID